jgi:hypothetical protein
MRKPHSAAEDPADSVNSNDALSGAPQEVPIRGTVRPTDTDRQRVQKVHVNFGNVLSNQIEGLHANRTSHENSFISKPGGDESSVANRIIAASPM